MSAPRPPGLPPDATRIDTRGLLEAEMNASRLQPALLPLTVYDAMLCVNALAVLEGAMQAQGEHGVRADAQRLQRFLLKHVRFTTRVTEQMSANRQFLQLPELL